MTEAAFKDAKSSVVYKRLMQFAVPQWRWFLLAVLSMLCYAGTEVGVAYMVKPLTDGSFMQRDPDVIRVMPFAILGVFILRGISSFVSSYSMAKVGQSVVSRVRCLVFEHIVHLPVSFHDQSRTADVQAKLTHETGQLGEVASTVFAQGVRGILTTIGLIGFMIYTSWQLTIFSLFIAPLVSFSITWVNRRFRTISKRIQESIGGITHVADEAVSGRRVLKIYGGEEVTIANFYRLDDYLKRQSLKLTAANSASSGSLELIAAVGVSALVALATQPAMLEKMTPGTFVSFIVAMLTLRQPLSAMTGLSERLQRGLIAARSIFAFLEVPKETDTGTIVVRQAQGRLEFDGVHFGYGQGASDALKGVTLQIPAGKNIAFVGKSGSGKSTLLSLLPRFYNPTSGRVLLDGHDLREYTLSSLRQQIALVDQNVVLFHGTVAENIAYGQQATSEQIVTALKRASAWEFVSRLPRGLDTPIGQGGAMLSGGQRQRLAIARALLKDAPILILDEATSALDTESERAVQDALDELKKGRTTLVIAHRLSTIQSADVIVVMSEGQIVEQGTHQELLSAQGSYAALHKLQFRETRTQ